MEMNEKHESTLRALLATEVLPEVVVKFYARLKKLADRKDVLITDQVLLLIASTAEKLPEVKASVTVNEVASKPEVQSSVTVNSEKPVTELGSSPGVSESKQTPLPGQPCEVKLFGKTRQAIYLDEQGPEKGRASIRFIGEEEVRLVAEGLVKLKE